MTSYQKLKRADTRDKRLKKIAIDAFNKAFEEYNNNLKNPFYRLKLFIKRLFKKNDIYNQGK